MNVIITILAHGSDRLGEREHIIPAGTTNLIADALADADITVDAVEADLADE